MINYVIGWMGIGWLAISIFVWSGVYSKYQKVMYTRWWFVPLLVGVYIYLIVLLTWSWQVITTGVLFR